MVLQTNLIEKLLKKDSTERLGYAYSPEEIKKHEFFRGVAGDLLIEVVRPPLIPAKGNGCTREAHHASA